MTTLEIMQRAKAACLNLARATSKQKDEALLFMAEALLRNMDRILAANMDDVEAARGIISDVMLDRLGLTESRVEAMAEGIRQVAGLPDPVGRVIERIERPNGLVIEKKSVPMGVVAIIYESRPNVSSDAAALALKSGNVCIL
ncbi:MAG TPA: gamma-glutamyl-phosphate reductase, partial [Bacillota bacterium]|nr:gamma-glutamyl-phosphate reductase [Bacillota bacterium]